MIEYIAEDLYRIEIPLLKSPLKALNSYVVKGQERNLIIDTGWNEEASLKAMHAGLRELGVDLARTDFFITHSHSDHLGLLPRLAEETSVSYLNKPDAARYRSGLPLDHFVRFACLNGFPEQELQASIRNHPGFLFRAKEKLSFHVLEEGDRISVGRYSFTCIETPGHTLGHLCLYEPGEKILVGGDHILGDISPNIQLWSDEWNPLKRYLESLDKVYQLDIRLVLPGHRNVISRWKERVDELREHHRERLAEIVSILEGGGRSAFEIGSMMSWNIVYESWDAFPVSQKWFAIGEVIAHLKYLEEEGRIRSDTRNGRRMYSLNR